MTYHLIVFAVFLAQLVPDRGQVLAVAAPRSIELYEHVLVVVDDKVGEGGTFGYKIMQNKLGQDKTR